MIHGQPNYHHSFNPQSIPEEDRKDSFEPAPEGWYQLEISGADLRQARSGGEYLKIEWTILGPKCARKRVWDMITTQNANEKAVKIGRGQLYRLSMAIGKFNGWQSLHELIGCRANGLLGIRKEDGYEPKNVIRKLTPFQALDPQPTPTQEFPYQPPPPKPAPRGDRMRDDDIPF